MSDDLIKREDAMQVAFLYPFFSDALMEEINAIPSADRPQGEWKRRIVDNGFNADWVCSECGYRVKTDFVNYKFCPNCGADMRGERSGTDKDKFEQ